MSSGQYDGAIWTQGSPQIEEAAYWFSLLIDARKPIACSAAQRPQGEVSADGPANIGDSVTYIESKIWSDGRGGNRAGVVVIQEQQFFAEREVAKVDARPGGYVATGDHGGVLGQVTHAGVLSLMYAPVYKHTAQSEVNLMRLPAPTTATKLGQNGVRRVEIVVKDAQGRLTEEAILLVSIVKDGGFAADACGDDEGAESDLKGLIANRLGKGRLCGFVIEGLVPYGADTSELRALMLRQASFCGAPVVRVSRGAGEGFADLDALGFTIAGLNLTSTKARLLLMACLMKFGSLPAEADPRSPTAADASALRGAVADYQHVFDTH